MKNKIIITSTLSIAFLLSSCFGDLDPVSLGPRVKNADNVYQTKEDYKKGLAKVYGSLAVSGQQGPAGQTDIQGIDEGFGNYSRGLWNCQELTTDEAVIAWNDRTIKDFHWHTWAPSDVFIQAMYYRLLFTATIANEFIRAAGGSSDPEIEQFANEARFIRALSYYYAIDMFGSVPLVTEADSPGAFLPKQATRAELFDYVESELKDLETKLGAPRFEYARADKAAAQMLLAKLYLNAEVYINKPMYTECIAELNKVFGSSYALASEYRLNFLADNHTSPEVIFPIAFDGANTQTYGGTTYIINASIGGSMPKAMFGSDSGWGGIRTTSAFVSKFADTSGATDKRAMFWTNGQSLQINDIGVFTDGYAITKFRNVNADGSIAIHKTNVGNDTMMDTDFPVLRLADAYLMFAEAVVRGGTGGTTTEALGYVNAVRERAYGDTSGNITLPELTLDFILDERARELYWEGHRRTDLIRFNKFTGDTYLWPWKGNVKEGVSTSAHLRLFPIPNSDLAANPTLVQNPGY